MERFRFKQSHDVARGIFLLAFALMCSMNVAALTFTIGSLKYITRSNTMVSATKNGTPIGDLVIPESVEYNGTQYSVMSIENSAFASCTGLTSVTLPNSVTTIGDRAFENCSGLTFVNIPNSVTYIGDLAFYGCSGLTSIIIPNSVTSFGNSVFYNCSALTNVVIPNSMAYIPMNMFTNCSALINIIIPNSVTSIGYQAFKGCAKLISVTIPNSVTSIAYGVFANCSRLTNITIPNTVTNISNFVFDGCYSLNDIYCYIEQPLSVTEYTFYNVSKSCRLHVPIGSASAYRNTYAWKDFYIIEDLTTGIVSIEDTRSAEDNDVWFTLSGVRLNGKPTIPGIYIVNGKRVVVK